MPTEANRINIRDFEGLVSGEFDRRHLPLPDTELVQKLARLAKLGLIATVRTGMIPPGGPANVAVSQTVAGYLRHSADVMCRLDYTVPQLDQALFYSSMHGHVPPPNTDKCWDIKPTY